MIGKIEKICGGALLALTAHGLYECAQLQGDLTRLVDRQNEIRHMQEERLKTRWGDAPNIDEKRVLEAMDIEWRGKALREENGKIKGDQESLLGRIQRFPNQTEGYQSLEEDLAKQREEKERVVSTDAEHLGRLRGIINAGTRGSDKYRSGLVVVYDGLTERKERRETEKRVEKLKRGIEEKLKIQNAKAEDERQRKYYEELYIRTSATDNPRNNIFGFNVAYEKFFEAIRNGDNETVIGLQSLTKDKPYTDLSWTNQFLSIITQNWSRTCTEIPHAGSHGNPEIREGLTMRTKSRIETIHNIQYFLERPSEGEKRVYQWFLNPTLENVGEKKTLLKDYREEKYKQEVLFVEFLKTNDGTCRIGQCGKYDIGVTLYK